MRTSLSGSRIRGAFALVLGTCLLLSGSPLQAAGKSKRGKDPYYEVPPLFFPCPKSGAKSKWVVKNFGPVGIGIDLIGTGGGFKMVINNVEAGSPAAATGKLQKKQVIRSINGHILKDRDPRMILGDIITEAEAKDGRIVLDVEGVGEVVIEIPVMGSYSETWPLACEKSDKIVRGLADFLGKMKAPSSGAVLFLLSTGEDKDLDVVRNWMTDVQPFGAHQWNIGYRGIGICEYYLRTGDKRVLPVIKGAADILRDTMYNGGWSGRGNPAQFTYSTGSGQMNAAGVHCMSFLILARMCGVEVDEHTFNAALTNFFRHSGHGNVPYGDGWPEGGFRDNGKTGGLAVAMALATRLSDKGEDSVYARARDISAMKSFYATNWFHSAHTGGGIGEIWHNAAMSLMHERRPVQHRSFIDTRRWVMELSRRHNGTIGIAGVVDRYDASAGEDGYDWGTFFALTYTIPRKTLQLSGAPATEWCETVSLPERPWGNAADDIFQSAAPASHPSISMADVLKEKVETDSSTGVFAQLGAEDLKDEVLLKYMHHPEYGLRVSAIRYAVNRGRDHLVLPLLKSDDARLRDVGLMAITGMSKGKPLPRQKITAEMIQLAADMLNDPNESWWVKIGAASAIATAKPEMIAEHRDVLLEMLNSEYWWLGASAGKPLTVLAAHPEHSKAVLPPLLDFILTARTVAGMNTMYGLSKALGGANKEVKAFAADQMTEFYGNVPRNYREEHNDLVITGKANYARKVLGYAMERLPGAQDYVKTLPKMTSDARRSGKQEDMYVYGGTFTPNKKLMGKWVNIGSDGSEESIAKWVKHWKSKGEKPFRAVRHFELLDKGRIRSGGLIKSMGREFFWSGDMMIGTTSSPEARKMKLVTVEGIEFLLTETGGFGMLPDEGDAEPQPDYRPRYQAWIRMERMNGKKK